MIHTRFALRRPVTTLMTFIAIALIGVIAAHLLPLELFPDSVRSVLIWLPFRSLLAFPVENALGIMDRQTSLEALAIQWGWIAVVFVLCAITWRAGTRRFAAFGG